jgi:LmbE family N-acetylglucosaminyl deacetylase
MCPVAMKFPSASDRILIFSPHPDDDVLAAGGLLQQITLKKIPVRIVFLTDGDNNPWPQRFIERRLRIDENDRRRWGLIRRCEALAALSELSIDCEHAVFLGLPDQGLTSLLLQQNEVVVKKIVQEITNWNPTVIIAPASFDLHPDHNAFAVILKQALRCLEKEGKPPIKVLHFSIHMDQPYPGSMLSIPLTSQQIVVKKSALMQHDSQMQLSSKRFLSYVKEQESFYLAPLHDLESTCHPIKTAFLEDGYLCLVMNKPCLSDRLLGQTLYVVSGGNPAICISLQLGFLAHGKVEIFDSSGTKSLAFGQAFSIRGSLLIRLPEAVLGCPEEVYVKQKTKFGFLDRAGWKNLPLSEAHSAKELPCAKTVALIPCYNVAGLCTEVIRKTLGMTDHVIVIDDGSTDGTGGIVSGLLAEYGTRLHVISRSVNEGKGSALLDGMQYALEHFQFSALITIDGDGQHRPEDIPKAEKAIFQGKNFVIGQRNFSAMPLRSRFGNIITRGIFRKLYPKCPSDTQSGFRAFSSKFVHEIVTFVHRGRYETELYTLLLALYLGLEVGVFQIDTIYIDENRSSHFRPVMDSMRIVFSLLRWQLDTLS